MKKRFVIIRADYVLVYLLYILERIGENLGKDMKGKELGKGLCQRKNGL